MKKCFLCLMALLMFTTAASAESVTLEGTVVSTRTAAVLAPAAGTLDEVLIQAGDDVEEGLSVASLMGTKVYAEEAGVVHIFGQEGDSVESLTERYGAVVFVEPDVLYTMTASTRYAYDEEENKIGTLSDVLELTLSTQGRSYRERPWFLVQENADGTTTFVLENIMYETMVSGTLEIRLP